MRFLVSLAFLASVALAAGFKNPVFSSDAPDPGVAFWDGNFWMATTGGSRSAAFALRSSPDLVSWSDRGHIFTDANPPPSWATQGCFWAPELHRVNGRWMAVFTARGDDGRLAIGGAFSKTDSPAGPYEALAGRLATHQYGAIDATVAADNSTGQHYLVWKVDGNSVGKATPILAALLATDGSKVVGDPVQLLEGTEPFEKSLVEGPWILFKNGFYYLFVSGSGYADPGYSVGVARSQKLLGPYTHAPAPVLSQRGDKAPGQSFSGPGHCSVVDVPGTGATVMVYHSWLSGHVGGSPGRVVLVDRVFWSGCNDPGWPCVGEAGTPTAHELPIPTSAEFAKLAPDLRLWANGTKIALASYQWHDHCWNGATGTIDGSCSGNMLYARRGNAGPGTISLSPSATAESGPFWRHRDGKLHLENNDGSSLFKMDSSFIPVSGMQDPKLVSLRPVNYPDTVVRHYSGVIQISEWDGTAQLAQDATWFPVVF